MSFFKKIIGLFTYLFTDNCMDLIFAELRLKIKMKLNYMMVRVFANAPGDLGLVPGRVIPKTLKMVLDAS